MSRWFRHYAGMMRDEKLVSAAIKSKQPIERVLWVWGAILESAAEIDQNGKFDLDPAEVAYFLRADETDIAAILTALTNAGRIADSVVVKWGNRQFTSDKSRDRVAAHRQRKRGETVENSGNDDAVTAGNGDEVTVGNDGVTLQKRHCNPPETETETDIPLANANGAHQVSDKEFWDNATAYLGGKSKRSLIGRWCKDYGQAETAKAITAAQIERAVEPVSYITKTLQATVRSDPLIPV